jgi:phage/plasmid-like protein (TIGR03299 family)
MSYVTHEIEVDAQGRAKMFSARELPWHNLGVVTPDCLTAGDAIEAAGLNWTVGLYPLQADTCTDENPLGPLVLVEDRFAVVRSGDNAVLGVVGTHYVPFNNVDAFKFMDNLVDSGDAKYETAGSLRKGKIVFMTMKVPKSILIGGEDRHDLYILLRTSHDGTKAISVYVTPIRVVCMNTLSLATYGSNVKQKWSVTHVGTVHGRLAEARDTLSMTFSYADEFRKLGDRLLDIEISNRDVDHVLDCVVPDRPMSADVKTQIRRIYYESPTVLYQGSAWGLLNAISEYYDWYRRSSSPEAQFINAIDGSGAKARNTATAVLLTL